MRRHLLPLSVLALAAAPPAVLLALLGPRPVHATSAFHLWSVGGSSGVAGLASLGLLIAGARARDARTVAVGGAFVLMTALLALHALATPGMLVAGAPGVLLVAGGLTVPVGAAMLAASAEPALRGHALLRPVAVLVGLAVAAVTVAGVLGLVRPGLYPMVPGTRSPAALALLAAGLGCLALLGLRAARTVLMTRRPRDGAAVAGVVLLGSALVSGYLWGWGTLGFWMGHGLELTGLLTLGATLALDLRDGAPSRALHGDLRAAELVLREETFLGVQVRSLMRRLAGTDAYTAGHTRRVALLATRIGEDLHLPHARLRELALAGLLHDVGKLQVPDAVLKKPGPLTDDEFALIRRHPVAGEALLAALGGFSDGVRRVVRGHHERLDGSGYPDGRRDLDLATRILAVCDVYDALVTARVYRGAWSHEDAVALLRREAGTGFDPGVVEALCRVLGVPEEPDSSPYAEVVALAEVAAAREEPPPAPPPEGERRVTPRRAVPRRRCRWLM